MMIYHLRQYFCICFLIAILLFSGCSELRKSREPTPNMQNSSQQEVIPASGSSVNDNEPDSGGLLEVVFCAYVICNEPNQYTNPNQLQAVIQNDTDTVVVDAVVAFVAWDSDNQPVKISESYINPYVGEVHYENIYLEYNDTFGIDNGYHVDAALDIAECKAIVVSYKNVDGKQWNNPEYNHFITLYAGVSKAEEAKEYAPPEDVALISGGLYTDSVWGTGDFMNPKWVFEDSDSAWAIVFLNRPNEAVIFDWEFPDGSVSENDRREDFLGKYHLFSGMSLENRGYGTGRVTVTLASSKDKLAEYEFEIIK